MAMTSTAASAATFLCTTTKSSLISNPKNSQRLHLSAVPFSPWSGLKHLGVSFRPNSSKLGKKGRCKGVVVYASLFGVGAPEALVIGVVALLVFGPKGLAEVARNLGKTLRAFQPTIRELQEVSRDFKSTLEKEIGLDDINTYNSKIMGPTSTPPSTTNTGESKTTTDPSKEIDLDDINTYNSKTMGTTSTPPSTTNTGESKTTTEPNGVPPINRAYTSEEYLKITEEQLKATAAQNQEQTMLPAESQSPPQPPQDTVEETAVKTPPPQSSEGES